MMYHSKSMKVNMNVGDVKRQRAILALLCVALLIGCAVLGMLVMRNNGYRTKAQQQFSQRIITAIANAVDETNRMSSGTSSTNSARLARVRQYVYHMDQMNQFSIQLAGGENGRLISSNAIDTLYTDLDTFEALIQGSKNSTMDIHKQLLDDLKKLQTLLVGN